LNPSGAAAPEGRWEVAERAGRRLMTAETDPLDRPAASASPFQGIETSPASSDRSASAAESDRTAPAATGIPWLALLASTALILALFLVGNDRVLLLDRDEPRYAGTARTMLETGDFIVPYFHERFRYQKPVLTYWLVAGAFALVGTTDFAARLAPGICSALACLSAALLAARMIRPGVAVRAAWMLALAPLVFVMAKLCVPDPIQFLWSTMAFHALWVCRAGSTEPLDSQRRHALLFWLAMSLAILTKGPIVPGMVLAFLAIHSCLTGWRGLWFRLRVGVGLPLALLVTLPWFVAILYCAGPGFFSESLGNQLGNRIRSSFDGRWWPPGYYVATTFAGLLPWTPLALWTLIVRRRELTTAGPISFLAAWIAGPLLLAECFRSKQPHYVMPIFPAVILLATIGLDDLAGRWTLFSIGSAIQSRWTRILRASLAPSVGLPLIIGAIALPTFAILSAPSLTVPLTLVGILAFGLSVAGLPLALSARAKAPAWRPAPLLAALALMLLSVGGLVMPELSSRRTVRTFAEHLGALERAHPGRVIYRSLAEPSMVWYGRLRGACLDQARDFLARARHQDAGLIVPIVAWEQAQLRADLPGRVRQLEERREILKLRPEAVEIVEIGPDPAVIADRDRSVPR
jgi:4-amino-4-deoxy-L-arabinose transferase-like glycosyltransferase